MNYKEEHAALQEQISVAERLAIHVMGWELSDKLWLNKKGVAYYRIGHKSELGIPGVSEWNPLLNTQQAFEVIEKICATEWLKDEMEVKFELNNQNDYGYWAEFTKEPISAGCAGETPAKAIIWAALNFADVPQI